MKSKETKRKESADRVEKWQSLTPQQQLNLIDERLGKGIGAKRQRAKLAELLPKPVIEPVVQGTIDSIKEKLKKPTHIKQGRVILK